MRRILFLCIVISACILFTESASYGFALNINPSSVRLTAKPGGTASGSFKVINKDHADAGIVIEIQDWLYDSEGRKKFYGAGTTPLSCAKWINIFPKKFKLEGQKSFGVQYTITVPEDAEGGYYAVIFFESMPLEEDKDILEGAVAVQFAGRLGAILSLEIEGKSVYKGSIKSLELTPPRSDKPFEMNLAFKNEGNVYIGAKGILNITDEKGKVLGKKRFGPLSTLPGDTRKANVEWYGDLEEGSYYALVTLDIGTAEPILKEVKFNVVAGTAIEAFSVDTSSEKPSFSLVLKNTGHLNAEASGSIELIKNGNVAKVLNLKKSLIAPGKEKTLNVILEEELAAGEYTARAVVLAGDERLTKEEAFTIR